MKIDAAYYYGIEVLKKERDIIPAGHDYFVLSAGCSRPVTRPFICTVHPPRRDYQLIYAHNGPIHYFDIDGTEYIAPAGSFLLYKPLEFQKYVVYKEENTVYYWCHFGGAKIEQFLKEHHLLEKRVFTTGENPVFCKLYNLMRQDLFDMQLYYQEFCGIHLRELLLTISRETQIKSVPRELPKNFWNVLEYIQNHYQENLTISKLCRVGMTNRKTLSKYFLEYSGVTPSKYIGDFRLHKSKYLLLQTDHKISEIALSVGFQDPLYFSSAFKKANGVSPRDYRNQNK